MKAPWVNGTAVLLILLTLATPDSLRAREPVSRSWDALQQISPGQSIQVTQPAGRSVSGTFVRVAEQSLVIQNKQGEITLARAEVLRVRLPAKHGRRNTWIGAGVGAAAGAGAGFGIAEQVASESGGDFANLRPAIVAVTAGVGALIGALLGSTLGGRSVTIYQAP